MTHRPLGAQISHMLKDRGVDVIFGIPGVHNQEMYRGIEEAGITHVLARHEQGAGFMADGYARATGRPGVAYVITGPGLCNMMTPMGQAYSDSVPMLVISSCLDDVAAARGQLHQMLDQEAAGATVCDWSATARTAEAAYALINRAFEEFVSARARPKHMQVPISVLEAAVTSPVSQDMATSAGAEASAFLSDIMVTQLTAAKKPVLILGGGAKWAASAVADVLANCPMAVFTTYAGRGIVAPDYPYLFGSMLARGDSAQVLKEADLVIAVGTELAEVDLWRTDLGHDAPMIRIDIDSEVLAAPQGGEALRFRAEAGGVFKALAARSDLPSGFEWQARDIAATRARWRAEINAERPGILRVVDALKAALPEGTMIYSDMTQFAYAAKEVWDMDLPGHWHHPTGFGTLGYALPAAIGGAVGRSGLPTMAIAGDYGLQYTIQELGTAVELGLPLPIFVWDNNKLGEIEDSMVAAQIAPNAVTLRNPDFCALAKAWGAYSARPETLRDMAGAVQAAFAADAPTLIHVTPDIAD